jgi:hypothetical protein
MTSESGMPPTLHEVTILARLLCDDYGPFPPAIARYVLGITLTERDNARMHELAMRNQND